MDSQKEKDNILKRFFAKVCATNNKDGFIIINPQSIKYLDENNKITIDFNNAKIDVSKMPEFLLNAVNEDVFLPREDLSLFSASYSNGIVSVSQTYGKYPKIAIDNIRTVIELTIKAFIECISFSY